MRIVLIRPLISVNRGDLNRLCLSWRLPIYPDLTNKDLLSPRNRLRQDLLPVLRLMFNPQVDNVLSQSAEILSAEHLYVDLVVSKLLGASKGDLEQGLSQLHLAPIAVKRSLLRKQLQANQLQRNRMRFSSLEVLLQRASNESGLQ